MRIFKFLLSLAFTVALIYVLDNRWVIGGNGIPPFGKLLDPFHGFWQNIETDDFRAPEKLSLPGLKQEVHIVFDSIGIPHIFAQNEEDLYYSQGYITAWHRLWQMEFQTHAAAGRVSEIIEGDAVLNFDRKQRRLGMAYGAEKAAETMLQDEKVSKAILAYTEGVNAYISQLNYKTLPFEYKLLDYKPEKWTPFKMGLLLKNLSQTLNSSESDLEMTNALAVFGKEISDLLYREDDMPIGDPIVNNPGGWKFNPVRIDSIPPALPTELVNLPVPKEKQKGIGSNNWAVHGTKTASGAPILCNDPHLNLTYPSIWYVVHLQAPGINTMGASLPGSPLVILGFNDSIAWGCTNAQRDLADWYSIKFRDSTMSEYLSDGKWRPTNKKVEVFSLRGGKTFYDTVVYTHHGPVVYDRSYHAGHEKKHYAFRWLAHDGSKELKTFYELNKGKNYNDYTEALRSWSGPAQNFVFASVQGDIAMRVQGKFPVRRKDEGKYILDGTKTTNEWLAFIPFEHNVHTRNPERGFVSSANQYPADETYPYYIHSDNYEAFRNRRINQVLSSKNDIRPSDMMALQNDNYNLQAAESLPLMLSMIDVPSLKGHERQVAEQLSKWDFFNSVESIEASYYEAWWNRLLYNLWDEVTQAKVSLDMPDDYSTIRLMKTTPEFPLFDIAATPQKETLTEIVKLSFGEALGLISEWENKKSKAPQWADYKDTYIQHLLMQEPLSTHVRVGGNGGIVNAAGKKSGPSWRYIVSLEKGGVKAWGVYPAGQSGNPGSPFYDNLVDYWAKGKYYRLNFHNTLEKTRSASVYETLLTPEKP